MWVQRLYLAHGWAPANCPLKLEAALEQQIQHLQQQIDSRATEGLAAVQELVKVLSVLTAAESAGMDRVAGVIVVRHRRREPRQRSDGPPRVFSGMRPLRWAPPRRRAAYLLS